MLPCRAVRSAVVRLAPRHGRRRGVPQRNARRPSSSATPAVWSALLTTAVVTGTVQRARVWRAQQQNRRCDHRPSAGQTAIRIANDLSADEIAGSAVARNTLILLRQAIERDGLPLTATGNLSRAVVADMRKLIAWPDYNQAEAFQFNKVINEPDFLPLHVVRQLAQAATLVRAQRGKLVATPLGKSMLNDAQTGSLMAILFHLAFWHMALGYFGRGLLGSWPQTDIGIVLWSLAVSAGDWQSSEKLTRLCTIPETATLAGTWDRSTYAMEARILRPLLWFGLLAYSSEKIPGGRFAARHDYRKTALFDRLLAFDVEVNSSNRARH
jgi:hypothetical protein